MNNLKLYTNTELPESEYHGEQFKDYLSGSELWGYFDACPAEVVYGEKKDSEALAFGSLVHCAVLEPDVFHAKYARDFEAPENCLTSDAAMKAWLKEHGIAGYSTKSNFELVEMVKKADANQLCFIDEQAKYQEENEGKEFIKPVIFDQLTAMRDTIDRYPSYSELIDNSVCESSIVGYSELLGVNVKTRPDVMQSGVICNYKTTSSAKPEHVMRDCYKYGYFMKEYLSALVVQELTGEFPQILILAQSKTAPYVCTGIKMTDEMIEIGKSQFEQAFALWKACKDANQYIDYAQNEWLEPEVPAWMLTGL